MKMLLLQHFVVLASIGFVCGAGRSSSEIRMSVGPYWTLEELEEQQQRYLDRNVETRINAEKMTLEFVGVLPEREEVPAERQSTEQQNGEIDPLDYAHPEFLGYGPELAEFGDGKGEHLVEAFRKAKEFYQRGLDATREVVDYVTGEDEFRRNQIILDAVRAGRSRLDRPPSKPEPEEQKISGQPAAEPAEAGLEGVKRDFHAISSAIGAFFAPPPRERRMQPNVPQKFDANAHKVVDLSQKLALLKRPDTAKTKAKSPKQNAEPKSALASAWNYVAGEPQKRKRLQ